MKEIWFLNEDMKLFNIFLKIGFLWGAQRLGCPKRYFSKGAPPPYNKAIVVVRP